MNVNGTLDKDFKAEKRKEFVATHFNWYPIALIGKTWYKTAFQEIESAASNSQPESVSNNH